MPKIIKAWDKKTPITAKEIYRNIERLENKLQGEILEYEVRLMRVEFRKKNRAYRRKGVTLLAG